MSVPEINKINSINRKLNLSDTLLIYIQRILLVFLAVIIAIFLLSFCGSFKEWNFVYRSTGGFQPYITNATSIILFATGLAIIPFIVLVLIEIMLERKKKRILKANNVDEEELNDLAEKQFNAQNSNFADNEQPQSNSQNEEKSENHSQSDKQEEASQYGATFTTNKGIDYYFLDDNTQIVLLSKKRIKL